MQTTDDKILAKIKKAKRGSLFFIDDFITFGNSKTVAKALERLEKNGKISRVARGIYSILEQDSILGELQPSTEKIAEATADIADITDKTVTVLLNTKFSRIKFSLNR